MFGHSKALERLALVARGLQTGAVFTGLQELGHLSRMLLLLLSLCSLQCKLWQPAAFSCMCNCTMLPSLHAYIFTLQEKRGYKIRL